MKRSFLTGSIVVMTLVQSLMAHGQIMDLPDPGGVAGGDTTHVTPQKPNLPTQAQFAGFVRLGALSRKTGGTLYKVDFAQGLRLQRLDLRVSANRVKIYQTNLVTAAGNKIQVQQLSNTNVIATNSVVNSENISTNENISSVEILAESYDGEADVILTAVAGTEVPKMTLRQEQQPQQPLEPVVVKPTTPDGSDIDFGNVGLDPYEPTPEEPSSNEPYAPDNGSIVYYGNAKFRPGMTVLLACDRHCERPNLWVATVEENFGRGEISIIQSGIRLYVSASDLSASTNCYLSFCVGDSVQYGSISGTVRNVFENGTVAVAGSGRYFLAPARDLRKGGHLRPAPIEQTVRCTRNNEYCVGDLVSYRGINVKISKIYRNGTATVRNSRNGYEMIVDLRDVIFLR